MNDEEGRAHCLDNFCEGDVEPRHDALKEFVFKINGQWFIAPRDYGGYGGSFAFLWPSRTPARMVGVEKSAPEFISKGPQGVSNFYDVSVEIFLRSNNIPPEPTGYKFIEFAEAKGWIESKTVLRPGLEQVRMKHVIGSRGYHADDVAYYVATNIKGGGGLHPVATCYYGRADGGGGAGFLWRPGIWADVRMNQKHCKDWPEIYLEINNVLAKIREG